MRCQATSWWLCLGVLAFAACDQQPPAEPQRIEPAPPEQPVPAVDEPEASGDVEPSEESEDLATEAPEADPASKTVKLRLDVSPRSARPVVWWGKQKLGEAPLTIERPRRSGPMNLVVKADGYLEHHTRLFTDRDDRLSVQLVRPTDAVGMLGFKRKPGMVPAPGAGSGSPDARNPAAGSTDAGAFVVPQGVTF